MPRKLVEKPYSNGEWSKARFFGFLRSNFRLMSRKWRPLQQAKENARIPYVGPNKRRKWAYKCAGCGDYFADKEVHIDHIVPCGSLKDWEDVVPFLQRLLVEADGYQILCDAKCHHSKTHQKEPD